MQPRTGILLLMLAGLSGGLRAGDDFGMSVSADILLSIGGINELVYPARSAESPHFSRLEWGIRHVFFAGPALGFDFLQKFSLRFSAYTNLNTGRGGMRNKDWLNHESAAPTHFSESDSELEPFTNWRAAADFHYRLGEVSRFSLFAGLGLGFYRWNLHDRLISYRYPPDNSLNLDPYIGKTTVRYRADYFFPRISFAAVYEYRRFGARLSLGYGFLAHIEAVDNHEIRGIRYRDRIFPGHFIGARLGFSLGVRKSMRIKLGLGFGTMLETQGYTIIEKPARLGYQVQRNRSGNSGIWVDADAGIEFELF